MLACLLWQAPTIEGVLEFRNQHFWLTGVLGPEGQGGLVGSVCVRVSSHLGDEQMLLAQVHALFQDALSPYLQHMTVQIEKDE
jgi:hypothetical protein